MNIRHKDSLIRQMSCQLHGSCNCNCVTVEQTSASASPLSIPVLSQPFQPTKIYASNETDEIFINALEMYDPLSTWEAEAKRTRWRQVAMKCQADSERLFRTVDPTKAEYFASGEILKLKSRWKYLKNKLAHAQTRSPAPSGTSQNGPSVLLARVKALVQREDSIRQERAIWMREYEEKRRQIIEQWRLMCVQSMPTVVQASNATASETISEAAKERPVSPVLSAKSSPSSSFSFSGCSIASLPSLETRDSLVDRNEEFLSMIESAIDETRMWREDIKSLRAAAENLAVATEQSIAEWAQDRKIILDAIL